MGCCSSCDDDQTKTKRQTDNVIAKSDFEAKELQQQQHCEPLITSTTTPPLPHSAYQHHYDPSNKNNTSNNNNLLANNNSTTENKNNSINKSPSTKSPYNDRHGSISREPTRSNFHHEALAMASPKTFHRLKNSFRVFIATWNVGDAEPASMQPLFAHVNDCGRGADIIFIGAQECDYKPSDVQQSARDHWNSCIDAIFTDYKVVSHRGLWSMRTVLLVREDVADEVQNVIVSREATGVGGVGGNKGGIALGCTAYETRLLFVSSHLAAHLEEVEKRNSDYFEIIEGIEKDFNVDGIEPLNYYHHVFWCGDLNYRIDLPRDEVLKAVAEDDVKKLHEHDQLIKEMMKGAVFNGGFKEAALPKFTPTYRFLRNTNPDEPRVYDDFKNRIPSWCDRILHKSLGSPVDEAFCVKYDAEHGVRSSDHSPVYGIFDINSREQARLNLEKREASWNRSQNEKQKDADDEDEDDEDDEFSSIGDHHILTITKVSGNDLLDADVGKSIVSDPYIVFRIVGISDPQKNPDSICKTPVIANNLNPDWKEQLFKVDLGTRIDVGMLYLHAVIFDEDMTVDDPLGQAVFPLDQVWEGRAQDQKKPLKYEKAVYHNGRQYGSLKLTMMVTKI